MPHKEGPEKISWPQPKTYFHFLNFPFPAAKHPAHTNPGPAVN